MPINYLVVRCANGHFSENGGCCYASQDSLITTYTAEELAFQFDEFQQKINLQAKQIDELEQKLAEYQIGKKEEPQQEEPLQEKEEPRQEYWWRVRKNLQEIEAK